MLSNFIPQGSSAAADVPAASSKVEPRQAHNHSREPSGAGNDTEPVGIHAPKYDRNHDGGGFECPDDHGLPAGREESSEAVAGTEPTAIEDQYRIRDCRHEYINRRRPHR